MAYTDITFYKTKYHGRVIPDSEFVRMVEFASDVMDQLTYDRLMAGMPEAERENARVQKAVCALADLLYQIEAYVSAVNIAAGYTQREDGTVVGKVISSVSSGSESISYAPVSSGSAATSIAKSATDIAARNQLLYQTVAPYLQGICTVDGVPLLYAGY